MPSFATMQELILGLDRWADDQALAAYTDHGVVRLPYRQLRAEATRWEAIVSALALQACGAVVAPLDSQLPVETLGAILAHGELRGAFTTAELAPRFDQAAPPPGFRAFGSMLLDAPEDDPRSWRARFSNRDAELPRVAPGDEAALFYTSGTTGEPKGAPLTHANLAFQQNALAKAGLVARPDVVLLPLPLHHVYPFVIALFTPFALGLTTVLPQELTGPKLVEAIRGEAVTVIAGVPRLYEALFSGVRSQAEGRSALAGRAFRALLALSRASRKATGKSLGRLFFRPLHERFGGGLRVLASGGSALDPELAANLESLGWRIAIGYGLTETSPILTLNPPGGRAGSVGRALEGVELRVAPVAAVDADVAPDHAGLGEVQARGPGVFAGYRGLPDKTREAFTADGWFRTGDLGRLDDAGWLWLGGRLSTMIVTPGGKNVHPEAVEKRFDAHPHIAEAGLLQKDGRLVDYALSRQPLERTRLGKIRRPQLAQRYDQCKLLGASGGEGGPGPVPIEEMDEADRVLLDDPASAAVWKLLARRFPDRRLAPETSPQLDLGVDSMGWLELSMDIRDKAGVELGEAAIARISVGGSIPWGRGSLRPPGDCTPLCAS